MPFTTPVILRPGKLAGKPGWVVFEGEGVSPFFPVKSQAANYALLRASQGPCPLEYRDAAGNVLRRLTAEEAVAAHQKQNDERPELGNSMRR